MVHGGGPLSDAGGRRGGGVRVVGNWGRINLRIPREDWGSLGKMGEA